jgi:acetyl esterase/lipase
VGSTLLALFPPPTTNRKAPPPANRLFPRRRLLPRLSCRAGFHNFSLKLAATVGAIVVSVAYRLAPEHRLPAAYDDCITALQWVSSHAVDGGDFEHDPWLDSTQTFLAVYLMGDSAGGNIAHHVVALRGGVEAWSPMRLRGAILVQPSFGAEQRTRSESECPPTRFSICS